jgi:DNA-binding response OmpR family regulator
MRRDAYSDAELSPIRQDSAIMDPVLPVVENEQEDVDDGRPTILVVDDEPDIINYMRVLLSKDYRLITCLDADSALQRLRKEEPNIVLSDVAMPGKDGYELCREIKQDIQLSHIPVILVTAKITSENQVEGLNVGADAYVTKPFDPTVLSALIQSQLKNRERVRNILSRSTSASEQEMGEVLSEYDQKFMDELYNLMEEELSNTELNINRITELLYMSRTKLYYKIKGLTGETPSAFFRTYKLNRAAELLKSGKYSVSEIVDKTGFSRVTSRRYSRANSESAPANTNDRVLPLRPKTLTLRP